MDTRTDNKSSPIVRRPVQPGVPKKSTNGRRIISKERSSATASFSFGFHSLKPISYISAESRIGIPPGEFNPKIVETMIFACQRLGIDTGDKGIEHLSSALGNYAREMNCSFAIDHNYDAEENNFVVFFRECDTKSDFIHISLKHDFEILAELSPEWLLLTKQLYAALFQNNKMGFYDDNDAWTWERMSEMAEPDYWEGSDDQEDYFMDYQSTIEDYESGEAKSISDSIRFHKKINLNSLIKSMIAAEEFNYKEQAIQLAMLCKSSSQFKSYDYFPHRHVYEGNPVALAEQVCFVVDANDLYYNEITETIDSVHQEYGQEVPHTFFQIMTDSSDLITKEEIKKVIEDNFPDLFYNALWALTIKISELKLNKNGQP
jgi:hypothetical protein